MKQKIKLRDWVNVLLLVAMMPSKAMASNSSSSMVWDGPLLRIAESLSGPVATSLSVICLACAAISLMLFEMNKSIRWIVSIILGFSIVSSAWGFMSMFGLTGALM